MAKGTQSGFIEQHVEKIVLGASLLLLLVAISVWVFSGSDKEQVISPTGIGMTKVTPSEAGHALAAAAEAIADRAKDEAAQGRPRPDLKKLEELCKASFIGKADLMITMGSPHKMPEAPPPAPKLERLALRQLEEVVPAPLRPEVVVAQEWLGRANEPDVTAAHVAFVYPWSDLLSAWGNPKLIRPGVQWHRLIQAVDAEVEEQLADGSWGSRRPAKPVSLPLLDQVGMAVAIPQVPAYDGSNRDAITQFVLGMQQHGWEQYVIEPPYWNILSPSQQWVDWKVNLPVTEVSKIPETGAMPSETVAPVPVVPVPVLPPSMGGAMSSIVETSSGSAATAGPVIQPGLPVPVPTLERQKEFGKLLAWFHDHRIKPGTAYRYRARLTLLNPLYGWESEFEDPAEARARSIQTAWSDWSRPAVVPKEIQFFLTGASPPQGTVSVTIYTRAGGQRVSRNFTVAPGQVIGAKREVELPNPADPLAMSRKAEVDFCTGAVVVSVDFDKKVFRGGLAAKTTELVYIDSAGKLHTRVLQVDKVSPEYVKYEDEVKAARPGAAVPGPGSPVGDWRGGMDS